MLASTAVCIVQLLSWTVVGRRSRFSLTIPLHFFHQINLLWGIVPHILCYRCAKCTRCTFHTDAIIDHSSTHTHTHTRARVVYIYIYTYTYARRGRRAEVKNFTAIKTKDTTRSKRCRGRFLQQKRRRR